MKQRALTLAAVVFCLVCTTVRRGAAENSPVPDWSKDFRSSFVSPDEISEASRQKAWIFCSLDRKGKVLTSKSIKLSAGGDFDEFASVVSWYTDVRVVVVKKFEMQVRPPWYEKSIDDDQARAEFLKIRLEPGDVVLVYPRDCW